MHEIDINNLEKYGLSPKVSAEQLAQDDYLEYADGTLKERAIPCVFDNCKPVQRRILYSMYDLKIFSNENTKKCARIVGDVIGRFQPTGDIGTYGALVTMVRTYINNTPYIIGQGGFGTQDTPENAAYRYCCTGDTLINTIEYGDITLKELADKLNVTESGNYALNINVFSSDGEIRKANKFIHSGKHPIYKLILRNGMELRGTRNHLVLIYDRFLTKWKRLDEITSDDAVIINATAHNINLNTDLSEAKFLGAMISEGYLTTRNRVGINNTDKDMVDVVYNYISNIIHHNNRITTSTLKSGKVLYTLMIESPELYNRLKDYYNFGDNSYTRNIPRWLRYKSQEYITTFLRYLFEGDGCVVKGNKKMYASITYWTQSKQLAHNILTLLLELGISPSIVNGNRNNKEYYLVRISKKHNLERFRDLIGFVSDRKNNDLIDGIKRYETLKKRTVSFSNSYSHNFPKSLVLPHINAEEAFLLYQNNWILMKTMYDNLEKIYKNAKICRVKKCISTGIIEDVYSLAIDHETHAFVTNGIISHNTECKLSRYSEDYLLRDLKYNAVEMIPNFDEEYLEPKFLPAVLPDILINGNTGIATPYMTWIPPHNAVDAIKLCIKYVENPDMSIREMINILKAPDFPTGGVISQMDSVYRFYNTGNGACTISGKWHKEVVDSKTYIVISEIPYMRTLDTFMDQLAKIKADKDIGYLVAGVDDFSADGKIHVRIRVSTGTKYDELLQILLKKTCLRYSQVMNMMVLLEDKQYKLLNLKEVVEAFVGFRSKCLYNKFKFEIETNDKRIHILDGLVTINKDIERAIQIVRKSSGKEDSIVKLMKAFDLTREQAEYIVMMRVYRLSNLEMKNVKDEINALKQRKKVLEKLTSSERNKYLDEEMIKEWTEILDKKIFSNKRKTEIQKGQS